MEAGVLDVIIRRLLTAKNGRSTKQVLLTDTEIRQLCLASIEIFLSQPKCWSSRHPSRYVEIFMVSIHIYFGYLNMVDTRRRQTIYFLVIMLIVVVEDGYEFFVKWQLVTIFSDRNYCEKFDNSGAMMCIDDTLTCSFQILKPSKKRGKILFANALPKPGTSSIGR